jgi:hypothetical protein
MRHSRIAPIASSDPRSSRLSPACRQLIDLLSSVGHGQVQHLLIRNGEPVFTPPPRVLRCHKIGLSSPRPAPSGDFALKRQIVELFQQLRALGDGRVERIDVADGLPLKLLIEDPSFGA